MIDVIYGFEIKERDRLRKRKREREWMEPKERIMTKRGKSK